MIRTIQFENYKALRSATIDLRPFNLLIGPNGSGKSSVIHALLHLRRIATSAPPATRVEARPLPQAARLAFTFDPPFDKTTLRLACSPESGCDAVETEGDTSTWPALKERIGSIRALSLDHTRIAAGSPPADTLRLRTDGSNLAGILARVRNELPQTFRDITAEFTRILPDYSGIEVLRQEEGLWRIFLQLPGHDEPVDADDISQGTLVVLALVTLGLLPERPALVCLEEADRGIHPRLLREVRDALYKLSHPQDAGIKAPPVQIIATTHSPYLLDLFRDHPEEVLIAQRDEAGSRFDRLGDQPELREMMKGGGLGDLWFSGILGGVPDERNP